VAPPQRNDQARYTYLLNSGRFDELGDRLHADLQYSLKLNNYEYMTEI
jgi:hypothetical protein